jgi:hypothetical protein
MTTKYDHSQPASRTMLILLFGMLALLGWMAAKGTARAMEIIHSQRQMQNTEKDNLRELY